MFRSHQANIPRSSQAGFSMIEVLAAMVVLGIVALATAGNTIAALKANKRTIISNVRHNLAIAKVEEFAAMDVSQIDDGDDATESNVTSPGTTLTFTRVTNVTVNADATRHVNVTVSCNNSAFPGSSNYSATFALLE